MLQVIDTDDERIQGLRAFGYSEREAAFLSVAALHSGYFLRRQYGQFLGKESAGTANTLIQKAVALEHVNVSAFANRTCVYHLCRRPFYEAIGQPNNRNRRERQPLSIKNRLMCLDFVLDHPEHRFLATEQDKLAYLDTLGIERSVLPAKRYRSAESGQEATRYFVEKFPIFLATDGKDTHHTEIGFCFVDEGARTVSRFETYLDHYGRLFAAIGHFRLIYVAAGPLLFPAAEQSFQRFLRSGSTKHVASGGDLASYFRARRLFEAGDFASFDRAKLIWFRAQRETFSSPEFDRLFERWKRNGDNVLTQVSGGTSASRTAIRGDFSTHLLERNYDLFGTLTSF